MVFEMKLVATAVFLLLVATAVIYPAVGTTKLQVATGDEQDDQLYLMRDEHYLYINATQSVDTVNVTWAFPPDYEYQVPLYLEVLNDTTANITHVDIHDDRYEPNKVVEFTVGPMAQDEGILIHFTYWVLVEDHEFDDLPHAVKFPKKSQLPELTKTWLTATKVVQSRSLILQCKTKQMKLTSRNNVITFAEHVAQFIKKHRYGLFLLELKTGLFLSQDAITTFFINGENVGRSHLACALFRANNIPARVLLAHNDQGFWTQMHYMVEYYVPDYGWVLLDSTKGETPYATKHQIINRVCYPEDEEDTKWDYILPLMRGEERWLWIDNDNVHPWYVDCDTGSKSLMFTEGYVTTATETIDYSFVLSRLVFTFYQQYLGMNLTGDNLGHFTNATIYQQHALEDFTDMDIFNYIVNMDRAYDEYKQIIV
jgi:hypothetical protein